MAYGDSTRVRELCGNTSTTNLSAATVTQAIAYGDSMINTFSGKDDWASTDTEYAMVQTASELFAAAYCLKRFLTGDKTTIDRVKELEEEAYGIAKVVRMGGNSVIIASQNYRTYPLNPDATPYRSTTGSSNSVDDSDLS